MKNDSLIMRVVMGDPEADKMLTDMVGYGVAIAEIAAKNGLDAVSFVGLLMRMARNYQEITGISDDKIMTIWNTMPTLSEIQKEDTQD